MARNSNIGNRRAAQLARRAFRTIREEAQPYYSISRRRSSIEPNRNCSEAVTNLFHQAIQHVFFKHKKDLKKRHMPYLLCHKFQYITYCIRTGNVKSAFKLGFLLPEVQLRRCQKRNEPKLISNIPARLLYAAEELNGVWRNPDPDPGLQDLLIEMPETSQYSTIAMQHQLYSGTPAEKAPSSRMNDNEPLDRYINTADTTSSHNEGNCDAEQLDAITLNTLQNEENDCQKDLVEPNYNWSHIEDNVQAGMSGYIPDKGSTEINLETESSSSLAFNKSTMISSRIITESRDNISEVNLAVSNRVGQPSMQVTGKQLSINKSTNVSSFMPIDVGQSAIQEAAEDQAVANILEVGLPTSNEESSLGQSSLESVEQRLSLNDKFGATGSKDHMQQRCQEPVRLESNFSTGQANCLSNIPNPPKTSTVNFKDLEQIQSAGIETGSNLLTNLSTELCTSVPPTAFSYRRLKPQPGSVHARRNLLNAFELVGNANNDESTSATSVSSKYALPSLQEFFARKSSRHPEPPVDPVHCAFHNDESRTSLANKISSNTSTPSPQNQSISQSSTHSIHSFSRRKNPQRKPGRADQLQAEWITHLLNDRSEGIEVRWISKEFGKGVFANKLFEEREFIVEYKGQLLSKQEGERRFKTYSKKLGSYFFFLGPSHKNQWIDATKEKAHIARYINHSKTPNAKAKCKRIRGIPRLFFVARRQIDPGEQICYDYNETNRETLQAFPFLKAGVSPK